MGFHAGMLALFVAGGVTATIACHRFSGRGVWFALLPLMISFIDLLHADLKTEKDRMEQIPRGH